MYISSSIYLIEQIVSQTHCSVLMYSSSGWCGTTGGAGDGWILVWWRSIDKFLTSILIRDYDPEVNSLHHSLRYLSRFTFCFRKIYSFPSRYQRCTPFNNLFNIHGINIFSYVGWYQGSDGRDGGEEDEGAGRYV